MKNFDRETQNWYLYKNLELLPASEEFHPESIPTFGLGRLWRGLLGLLTDELIEEQRVEYLERCLQRDMAQSPEKARFGGVRRFFKLIE
jgi:hypothetical protein